MNADTEILAFLKAYPTYTFDHAESIYRFCVERGIPQCGECKDWHFSDEECYPYNGVSSSQVDE